MTKALSLKYAEDVKNSIMESQQKEIKSLYAKCAKDISFLSSKYASMKNPSAAIATVQMAQLEKQLKAATKNISNEIYKKIENNLYIVSDAMISTNAKWLKSLGFASPNISFTNVSDDIVKNILTGNIYNGGWNLSKAIWGDNEATLKDIHSIIASGRAMNMSSYEVAKNLESYVNPDKSKLWNLTMKDGTKIYKKSIDYNAQRLARTLTQHAYQQSFVTATKDNPFVKEYIWHSNGSRACDLCKARDGKHYSKFDLPLDHPNGMCVMEPVVVKDLEDKLVNWFNSEEGEYPEIDKFASNFKYTPKQTKKEEYAKVKVQKFTANQDKLLSKYGYTPNNIPDYYDWLKKANFKDFDEISLKAYKEGINPKEYYCKYLAKTGVDVVNAAEDVVDEVIEKVKTKKVPTFTKNQEKFIGKYGYTVDNIPDFDKWLEFSSYDDSIALLKLSASKGIDADEYYVKYIQKVKYKTVKIDDIIDTTEDSVEKIIVKTGNKTSDFNKKEYLDAVRNNNIDEFYNSYLDWCNGLSKKELAGFKHYTSTGYRDMNGVLRKVRENYYDSESMDAVKYCSQAFKRSTNIMKEDFYLRRGDDIDGLKSFLGKNFEHLDGQDLLDGIRNKTLDFSDCIGYDGGFFSTTPKVSGGFHKEVNYVIKVPKDVPGAYVDKISSHTGELEFLIDKGSSYIIKEIEWDDAYGNIMVYIEYIPK